MKKLKPVFLACLIGCLCALWLFKDVSKNVYKKESGNAVAIQIGAFTREENANAMRDNYGGIVVLDKDVYRVYYSVLSEKDNVEYITDYLSSKGINYYLRDITLNESALSELNKYESLMQKSTGDKKLTVNEEILKTCEDVI